MKRKIKRAAAIIGPTQIRFRKVRIIDHPNTRTIFRFEMGQSVRTPSNVKGIIIGQWIDRNFVTQALVQYNLKNGRVAEDWFHETELKELKGKR